MESSFPVDSSSFISDFSVLIDSHRNQLAEKKKLDVSRSEQMCFSLGVTPEPENAG